MLDKCPFRNYNIAYWHIKTATMIIKTRVFELANGKYHNLSDLARAMELSISQVYRVREGKRTINHKFIIGAKKAFPEQRLDDLFYFKPASSKKAKEPSVTKRYNHIVQRLNSSDLEETPRRAKSSTGF
jgi:hypothetical protein